MPNDDIAEGYKPLMYMLSKVPRMDWEHREIVKQLIAAGSSVDGATYQ